MMKYACKVIIILFGSVDLVLVETYIYVMGNIPGLVKIYCHDLSFDH
jgi:hypothetical protein